MGVSKVIYGGNPIIDISDSTVTAESLEAGKIAYGANGERITGTAELKNQNNIVAYCNSDGLYPELGDNNTTGNIQLWGKSGNIVFMGNQIINLSDGYFKTTNRYGDIRDAIQGPTVRYGYLDINYRTWKNKIYIMNGIGIDNAVKASKSLYNISDSKTGLIYTEWGSTTSTSNNIYLIGARGSLSDAGLSLNSDVLVTYNPTNEDIECNKIGYKYCNNTSGMNWYPMNNINSDVYNLYGFKYLNSTKLEVSQFSKYEGNNFKIYGFAILDGSELSYYNDGSIEYYHKDLIFYMGDHYAVTNCTKAYYNDYYYSAYKTYDLEQQIDWTIKENGIIDLIDIETYPTTILLNKPDTIDVSYMLYDNIRMYCNIIIIQE